MCWRGGADHLAAVDEFSLAKVARSGIVPQEANEMGRL